MGIFKNKIESFEVVTLREVGMRHAVEYEIVKKDGEAELSRYTVLFGEDDGRKLEESVSFSDADALALLNKCRVLSWDGFHGSHPKGVLDGTIFKFDAVVNGKKIHAGGSQNFPRHYRDFTDALYEMLK